MLEKLDMHIKQERTSTLHTIQKKQTENISQICMYKLKLKYLEENKVFVILGKFFLERRQNTNHKRKKINVLNFIQF